MTQARCDKCGQIIGDPRSKPHHDRYRAILTRVYHNLPESWCEAEGFYPMSEDNLNHYIMCKVGWRVQNEVTEYLAGVDVKAMGALSNILKSRDLGFLRSHDGKTWWLFQAKSTAHKKMGHKQAVEYLGKAEAYMCDILDEYSGDEILAKYE
jgi:hypothetical protein